MDFQVTPRYADFQYIGEGAYGIVVSAQDTLTQTRVAIKKSRPFEHTTQALRTLREIKILNRLRHENIISILDLPTTTLSADAYTDVFMVMDLMETDLFKLLQSQPLSGDHIRFFVYQMLRGLKFIHSANVLHRDLKPSNILINSNCDLKICDFGLARTSDPEFEESFKTEYVATRWYRAPEVILNPREYTKAIDLWSVGCIMGEMFGRTPMFPGTHYIEQVDFIINVVGKPSPEDIAAIHNERARTYLEQLPANNGQNFMQMYPCLSADPAEQQGHAHGMNLLYELLTFNPGLRFDCEMALAHPYLAEFHHPDDEPVAQKPFIFEFDDEKKTRDELKQMFIEETLDYFPQANM